MMENTKELLVYLRAERDALEKQIANLHDRLEVTRRYIDKAVDTIARAEVVSRQESVLGSPVQCSPICDTIGCPDCGTAPPESAATLGGNWGGIS